MLVRHPVGGQSGWTRNSISPTAAGDNLVVYWNTVASLDTATPQAWQSIALDTANLGEFEPSYDPQLWASSNKLDLLYQAVGQTAVAESPVQVLDWDEAAYFAAAPEPTSLILLTVAGVPLLSRRGRRSRCSRQAPRARQVAF